MAEPLVHHHGDASVYARHSPIRLRCKSTDSTLTDTDCPALNRSCGSTPPPPPPREAPFFIFERCNNPAVPTPTSTKHPNGTTLRTTPRVYGRHVPRCYMRQ